MSGLTWLDLVFIAVLLGSMLIGAVRGLVYEVLALLGWVVAWLVARAWGLSLASLLHLGAEGSNLQRGAGYALAFVLALLAWRIVGWCVRQLLHASPLAPVDRLLGTGFGLLRGALILLVLVGLADLTPVARMAWWSQAAGVQHARAVLQVLAPVLPGNHPEAGNAPQDAAASRAAASRAPAAVPAKSVAPVNAHPPVGR
jgi:membrane protein required for colicin V production